MNTPKAPAHLSEKSRLLWASINGEYELAADAVVTLQLALENLDLGDRAREQLRSEGLVLNGKPHPASNAVKLHDGIFLRGLRALSLDIVQPGEPKGRRA